MSRSLFKTAAPNFVRCVVGLILVIGVQSANAFHAEMPPGLTPERATWLWGHHSIPGDITKTGTPYWYVYPHTDIDRIDSPAWSDVAATHIMSGMKVPAILVLHSCAGMPRGTTEYRQYFIEAGFAVFEPDSYARQGPGPGVRKCNRNSLKKRLKELEQAIVEINKLDWVDHSQLFLMGFGEGGRVVAGWNKGGFAGHIILAANCWTNKNRGIVPTGPKNVPVLAVVGEKDPYLNGAKCSVNENIPGSNSIVIEGAGHFILDYPETGMAIHNFMHTVRQ